MKTSFLDDLKFLAFSFVLIALVFKLLAQAALDLLRNRFRK